MERGAEPIELFGGNRLPRLSERPWSLTLGPHNFFWFSLEPQERLELRTGDARICHNE